MSGRVCEESGGVEELWRRVWLDKEEEERREEKRDDNSLIPSFPLLLLTFYTSIFLLQLFFSKVMRRICDHRIFLVRSCTCSIQLYSRS